MSGLLRHKSVQGALAALTCASAVALLAALGYLQTLEFKTLDHRFRSLPRWSGPAGPAGIEIVLIDQTSLESVNRTISQRWPWPREFYAKMIAFLRAAGARAIIFDMYFSEPDMDRPEITGADSDAALVAATAFAANVVHSCTLMRTGMEALPDRAAAARARAAFTGSIGRHPLDALASYRTGALPSPELASASAALGFATLAPERDNICRRLNVLAFYGDTLVQCQALAALPLLADPAPAMRLDAGRLAIGHAAIPLDPAARAFLRWYRPATADHASAFPHHSAFNILRAAIRMEAGMDTGFPEDAFRDRIVYIGSSAPGLFDIWTTPLSHAAPGVEIQATALANMLRGDIVTRVPAGITLALTLLGALLTAAATCLAKRHAAAASAIPALLMAAVIAAGYGLLAGGNLFLDIIPPSLAILSTFVVTTLVNYLTERRHSRMVRGIFEHYLDHSVVENLIANPENVRLGGERRECTVMFSDVADFTSTSERLTPEQVVRFMNIYLDAMTDIIIQEGGFVDKFIGDEIVAVFGAPGTLPDHAACACRAALRMRDAVVALQPRFREAGCTGEIFARAGMCTGDVIIGNMGSESRMNYTAMGNTMNLGARIQGVNKMVGTRILVARATAEAAGTAEFVFREIDAVRVKGKQQAEHVHELLGFNTPDHEYAGPVGHYSAALDAYRRCDWEAAIRSLEPLIRREDLAAAALAARCRGFLANPPPPDWDGIASLSAK